MLRAGLALVALVAMLGGVLFAAAGRLDYPMAWAFLGVFTLFSLVAFAVVDPALLRERAHPGPGSKGWDVALASTGFLGLYPGTVLVSGLDVGRLAASPPIPLWVQAGCLFGFVACYGFALWAMRTNRFFSTFVRIQSDRGHHVIDTGPYAWVRHPGYAGALLAHLLLPLALGSWWGLLPAGAGVLLFVIRTGLEDRTLARELPGYADYQRRVPWRLVPGLW